MLVLSKDGTWVDNGQPNTPAPAAAMNNSSMVPNYNSNTGVTNLGRGMVYELYTITTSLSFTTNSAAGSGAVNTKNYIFNNSFLNALVTNNGSGAGSIVSTYGDGFTGKVYEQYFKTCNPGQGTSGIYCKGLFISGFTVQITNATSGDATSQGINTLAMNILAQNGEGESIPIAAKLAEAIRNAAFISGTYTVNFAFFINALTQISFVTPPNTNIAFTFFTQASGNLS